MFKPIGAFSGFSVKDLKKAKEFYSNVLGLRVEENSGEEALDLYLPGGAKVFVYPKANHEPATYTALNLVIENIDDAVKELTEKGVTFEQYDFPGFKTDEKGVLRGLSSKMGMDIAWFKDPDGNIFSILQEK